ncbi:MAG: DeoR/GlpR family DNA-binding transcription regulator [Clostridia bacterium]
MFRIEREKIILQRMQDGSAVKPSELAALTGASSVTIRRDLCLLEQRGLIFRSHGCAQMKKADDADLVASLAGPSYDEKDRIARVASTHVQDGDNIFLGAGTTCTLLAKYLKEKKNLTVMTPNLDAVMALSRTKTIRVSILGGEVQVETNYVETMDEYILAELHRLYFDKVFITVNGIDFDAGYSILKQKQLPLYHHLLENSANFYVMADSTKFGRRAFVHLCDMSAIAHIVTTRAIRDKYREAFDKYAIQVFCA